MTTKILCDADFLVAFFLLEDSNYLKAREIYSKYFLTHEFVFLSITKYELATVLSRKLDQSKAMTHYKLFEETFQNEIWFQKEFEGEVLYKKNLKKFLMILSPHFC